MVVGAMIFSEASAKTATKRKANGVDIGIWVGLSLYCLNLRIVAIKNPNEQTFRNFLNSDL